ncbi:hypothetical protein [Hymenobacter metallicola]|uniref:DUF4134 domain-containing protein n=1 Tax=Hymenobacter metallicola TaxID=2563114 RepID=A0A4Z0QCK8_9BACT|nr:hypothetical protein [Hymenobacter metallicola]TGE27424.1 hypothetical protein E5K02_13675 [Hymenobacter metallicola]
MKKLQKLNRMFAVVLLSAGLFGMASASNKAVGASVGTGHTLTGSVAAQDEAAWAYEIGYVVGEVLRAAVNTTLVLFEAEQSTGDNYSSSDFSSFDK